MPLPQPYKQQRVYSVGEGANMLFHERKSPRIPQYDYSTPNYYFITICTENKACLFWSNQQLNSLGIIAEECLKKIPVIYPNVELDKYVVMPNHIHAILVIKDEKDIQSDIRQIIGQYKMSVTKKIHENKPDLPVWQRSFYDYIIRSYNGYLKIWNYIDGNPAKWEADCFYQAD